MRISDWSSDVCSSDLEWDLAALVLCAAVFLFTIANRFFGRSLTLSRNLAFSAIVLLAVYLLLPRVIFGSAYADMRLVPYAMAVALLAIRFREGARPRFASALAIGAQIGRAQG